MANELSNFYFERKSEIDSYIRFLTNLDAASRDGAPRFKSTNVPVTTEQMKILHSSVYLQLYNLVEATVSRFVSSLEDAVRHTGRSPRDLTVELRGEWVRTIARTHVSMDPEKRLAAAMNLYEALADDSPVANFKVEVGGGGNWDDRRIEEMCRRVGCALNISEHVRLAAKRNLRDDMGALRLVKDRRNSLAHGSLSFVDCSDGVTVGELETLVEVVGEYLRESVVSFVDFIDSEVMQYQSIRAVEG